MKSLVRLVLLAGAAMLMMVGLAVPASANEEGVDVTAALEAAGIDADDLPQDLIDRVNERIDSMIEADLLTEEQLAYVIAQRDAGTFDELITDRIEAKRDDRDEHRDTLIERLAELGIVVAEGQSLKDALADADFDKKSAKELLKSLRPDDDDDDDDEERSVAEQVDRLIDKALKHDNRGRSAEAHLRNEESDGGRREGLGPRDSGDGESDEGDSDDGDDDGDDADDSSSGDDESGDDGSGEEMTEPTPPSE